MRYLGGKSRIAKDIADIINKFTEDKILVSLFCGSCVVESLVKAEIKICNDKHPYLIEMFKALLDGWQPPDFVSFDEYKYIKEHLDENKPLSGFVGFGCSFGGMWFQGFARDATGTNYASQTKRSLTKTMLGLTDTVFTCLDYKELPEFVFKHAIVYCDPPYANTKKYSNSDGFNHEEFWEYVRKLSKTNLVFISELNAPEDFICVWSKSKKRMLSVYTDSVFESIEKLFVHKDNFDIYFKNDN